MNVGNAKLPGAEAVNQDSVRDGERQEGGGAQAGWEVWRSVERPQLREWTAEPEWGGPQPRPVRSLGWRHLGWHEDAREGRATRAEPSGVAVHG